jgi:hypothetical protein
MSGVPSGFGEGARATPGGNSKIMVGRPLPKPEAPKSAEPAVDPALLTRENQSLRDKLENQTGYFLQEIQTLRKRVAELETLLGNTSSKLHVVGAEISDNRIRWQDFAVEIAQEVVRSILAGKAQSGELPLEDWVKELVSRVQGPGKLTIRVHPADRSLLGFDAQRPDPETLVLVEDSALQRGQLIVDGVQWKAEVDWRPWVDEVFHEIRGMLGRESLS